jgi:hypothetical protein
VAAAPEQPREAAPGGQPQAPDHEATAQAATRWLRPAEGILGGVLVVLAATTLYLGVRWRRRGR